MSLYYKVYEFLKGLGSGQDGLVIANDHKTAEQLYHFISFFHGNTFFLQALDRPIYSQTSASSVSKAIHASTLARIANCNLPKVVIMLPQTFFQKVPPEDFLSNLLIKLRPSMYYEQQVLSKQLIQIGFNRVEVVRSAGEFAQRGDIIDIVSADSKGVRIYFDYDRLDKIKSLDVYTQRSLEDQAELKIACVNNFVLDEEKINRFKQKFYGKLSKPDDLLHYEMTSKGIAFYGIENLWPVFFKNTSNILDLVNKYQVFSDCNLSQEYTAFKDCMKSALNILKASTSLYSEIDEILISESHLEAAIKNIKYQDIKLTSNVPNFYFEAKHNPRLAEKMTYHFIRSNGFIIISVNSLGNLSRIQRFLEEYDLQSNSISSFNEARKGIVNIYQGELPSMNLGVAIIIEDKNIYGAQSVQISKRSSTNLKQYVFELNNFEIGEIVVHKDYGIGRFSGVEVITIEDVVRDYVKLLYADDDKVYIPVENIDLIKKFGEGEAKLDKLGTSYWQKRKASLKNKITELAYQLTKFAALRVLADKKPLVINSDSYKKFCKFFPYVETKDQEAAIADILNDFATGKILDRLICGDVGYGKTEVAMRATFVVLDNDQSAQVAIISPTTILARQHFIDFEKRFALFGFNVKQLSRLVANSQQKKIKEQIEKGQVSIILGTHGLLSDSVKFNNLKLVIIDEEHQFGVKQKESLKALKKNCHIISLSATPIPRTMQMSLVGIRDLSIMASPPFNRSPVQTFLIKKDLSFLKQIIANEIARNGQVFYVVPKIEQLYENYAILKDLNFKIGIAHGRLKAEQLDRVLQDFYDKKFDLLLSTNIVQSGVDIPNANTIIVDDAELFGLAQLYQLRGRVGRGAVQGYSYFIYDPLLKNTLAHRRLQVIESNQELGSGFNIASYDMELRGYGNLLGQEQSGVIKEVGVELYQEMLKEAIAKNKEDQEQEFTPKLNLQTSIHIPESYIADANLRLIIYRRIASISNVDEGSKFMEELNDRFGAPPIDVANLLEVVKIKAICKQLQIASFDVGPKGFVIKLQNHRLLPRVIDLVNQYPNQMKLKEGGKLVILNKQDIKSDAQKLDGIHKTLKKLQSVWLKE